MLQALVLLAFAISLIGGLLLLIKSSGPDEEPVQDFPGLGAGQARANRMQAGLRRRRGARAATEDSDEDQDGRGAGAGAVRGRARGRNRAPLDGEDADNSDDEGPAAKPSTRRDAYEARRAAKDAEREAQEAAQEEEMRRAAEERARKEEEEAAKWMHMFTVEAAGEDALSREEGEVLLKRMVDYLKRRKTVALEEVGAEFNLRTAEVVAKLQSLEGADRITGVMDDRGKYIYVSREEMAAVAEFIRQRGRIPIAELAAKSSTLIDLEGDSGIAANEVGMVPELEDLMAAA